MSYERYSPTGFGFLPPVVKNLLIINVLFFLATIVLGNTMNLDLTDMLGLHYLHCGCSAVCSSRFGVRKNSCFII